MEAPGPPSHRDSHLPSSLSWVPDFSFSASSFWPSVSLICLGGGSLPQACLSWSLRRDVDTSISSPLCRLWVLRFLSPSLFPPHSPVYPFSEVFILFSRLPPRPVSHFWSGSWHLRERQEALLRALVLPCHPLPELIVSLLSLGFPVWTLQGPFLPGFSEGWKREVAEPRRCPAWAPSGVSRPPRYRSESFTPSVPGLTVETRSKWKHRARWGGRGSGRGTYQNR